jgi:hypothetical protein
VVARGKEEIPSEWILDESLIRLTWKTGAESRQEFHGIDPATGQWTIWGFDSKGGRRREREGRRVELPASGQGRTGRCPLSTRT